MSQLSPGPRGAARAGAGTPSRATPSRRRAGYALAVYLFAPVAVVVPITISTAVGAATIVGERERGTGEFLAHSPAGIREIFLGKLVASLVPGYVTTIVGFGIYSLIVNTIVGPDVGGWFFPTSQWWVLMLWVVPPFLALTLSLVLRLSAKVKSTAAAQQASAPGEPAADHGRLQPGHRQPLRRRPRSPGTSAASPGCSPASPCGAASAPSPAAASSASPTSSSARPSLAAFTAATSSSVRAEREAGDGPVGVPDDALGVDHERRAAVEAERAEDAVGLAHRLVGVGEQREARSRPACRRSRRGSATDCGLIASTWAPASVKSRCPRCRR